MYIYILCMYRYVHMYMYPEHVQYPKKARRGIRSYGTIVEDGCGPGN